MRDTEILNKVVILQNKIQEVARLRQEAQIAKDVVKVSEELWEFQNVALLNEETRTTAEVRLAEEKLRQLTLEYYELTKDKSPVAGVGIRIMTELVYDQKEALLWAKGHDMALALDKKAFEKIASLPAMDIPFVIKQEKPIATIATNLESEVKP